MAKQVINLGTAALKGKDGDSNRLANTKNNSNHTELYNALGADQQGNLPQSLPITKGGTGATTAEAAKQNLGIDQVDNTPDAQKPISAATQQALNTKADNAAMQQALDAKADKTDLQLSLDTKVDRTDVIAISKGGTGATTAAAAKANLGLGSAADRNVGGSAGNVMEVGAFGLGGTIPNISLNLNTVDDAPSQLAAWYESWNAIHFKNGDYGNLNKPNWTQLLVGRNGNRGALIRSSYNGNVSNTQLYGEHSVVPVTNGGTGATTIEGAAQALACIGAGQKFVQKKDLRAIGVNYVNTTGRVMLVCIRMDAAINGFGGFRLIAYSGPHVVWQTWGAQAKGAAFMMAVENGATYSLNLIEGSLPIDFAITEWVEFIP